jgi:hypothetical protein
MPDSTPPCLGPYRALGETFQKYWLAYGGWRNLLQSPYLHGALLVALGLHARLVSQDEPWFALVIAVIPSLLGFTLAGYAFLIGVGNDRFRDAIRGVSPDGTSSPFMQVNAAFVHFIVLQFFALLYAIIGCAISARRGIFAFVGLLLFLYALCASLAAVMAVLRLADWFDRMPVEEEDIPGE